MQNPGRCVARLLLAFAVAATSLEAQSRPPAIRHARVPLPDRFIVVLASDDDPGAVGAETEALFRGRLRFVYRHAVHGFAIRMPRAAAAALARDPRVAYVEEDAHVEASATESPAPWGLDRIDQRTLPLNNAYTHPAPVRQVHVHVIDSGIRTTHLDFGGRAFVAGDYVDDDLDFDPTDVGNDDGTLGTADGADCNGHGTHVAAIIAGATYGVAKNALIFSHRALDCTGTGTISAAIAAVDAVTADPVRPAVANMSLTGDASETLDAAVRRAIGAGITFVVAAGNRHVDAATQSPSRVTEAITVAATNLSDLRSDFSNFGPAVDLFAPGEDIRSAWFSSDTAIATMSGTSMAAPHVAGVAALYLEQSPAASPAAVRDALVAHATIGVVMDGGPGTPNRLLYSGGIGSNVLSTALPSPWTSADVGTVGAAGRALFANDTFTLEGAGADIWGTSDAFRFAYRRLSGDGTIVARVSSIQNVAAWSKAAVMIRESLTPGAANAMLLVSAAKGLSFQRRTAANADTTATLVSGAAPSWIKLVRNSSVITSYRSGDGVNWTKVASASVTLSRDVLIGLAVTSHTYGRIAAGAFDNVTVTGSLGPVTTLSLVSQDIGSVGVPGSTTPNGDGNYIIKGAGSDIWNSADAFRYLNQPITGDFDFETHVDSVDPVNPWTKAGVMVRESLNADAKHAFALVSAAKGIALQYRAATAGASAQAAATAGAAPAWVKLTRRGSILSAYTRTDGGSWQSLGSATIAMSNSIYVGVAVTSHDASRAATVSVSGVRLTKY